MKSVSQKKEDLTLLKMRASSLGEEIDFKIKMHIKIQMDIQLLKDDIRRDEAIS